MRCYELPQSCSEITGSPRRGTVLRQDHPDRIYIQGIEVGLVPVEEDPEISNQLQCIGGIGGMGNCHGNAVGGGPLHDICLTLDG